MQPQITYSQVFLSSFIPPVVHFREKQLKQLLDSQEGQLGPHYYCEGAKSTGKTLTALKLLENLRDYADQHKGLYFRTERSIMMDFKASVEVALDRRLKFREHPIYMFNEFPQKHIHVIIDDAQKIMHFRIFNDFLHSLYERTLQHNKTIHLYILGTTPFPTFLKHIRDDVESRYQFKPMLFSFYNADEIQKILVQRLDLCNVPYEEGAVNFTAAKVRRLSADLRLGFQILRNACEITQGQKITMNVIEQAWEKTKTDYWIDQIKEMDEHSQLLLLAATKLAVRRGTRNLNTLDINNAYRKICFTKLIDPLYAQRLNYLYSKLVASAWFSIQGTRSRGRRGKGMDLHFEMTPETILKALETIWEKSE